LGGEAAAAAALAATKRVFRTIRLTILTACCRRLTTVAESSESGR